MSTSGDDTDPRRRVPSVDQILRRVDVQELATRYGRALMLGQLRRLLDELRENVAKEGSADAGDILARTVRNLAERLQSAASPSLRRVINATGVVIHTNLGRAPLPIAAATRVAEIATAYSNLEFDLATGERGDREVHAESRLRELLGVEAALVVNNNAASVLLAVNTLAEGREVLVSRGELVEIGGSFRIPEILRKGGARLREVGTTNRTRIADYRAALSTETALILKVHPSNFRIVGFTEAPALADLVSLAASAGVPLVEDLGGGLLAPKPGDLGEEPVVGRSLAAGVDVVTFSGDKLLGGPQAGLVVGRRSRVEAMRSNPLYRALRVGKMTMAALDAVLAEHEAGRAEEMIPVLQMLSAPLEAIGARTSALLEALRSSAPRLHVTLMSGASAVGGGTAPTTRIPTVLAAIAHPVVGPDRLAAVLRAGSPPIVARVADDRLILDLRTVPPEEDKTLIDALARACSELE